MRTLTAIWRLLDARQRWQVAGLQVLALLSAVSTISGVAAVLPFLAVLADPAAVQRHAALAWLYARLDIATEREFALVLGLLFVGLVLLGNLVTVLSSLGVARFSFRVGDAFQVALFREYLHRSYAFHTRTNSAVLVRNILHEAARVTSGIVQSALSLVAHVLVIVGVVLSVVIMNPLAAAIALVALGGSYVAIYAASRRKLRSDGATESRSATERTRVLQESFAAIKEVILLQGQGAWSSASRALAVRSRTHS